MAPDQQALQCSRKIAVVTASTAGIGLAVASKLASDAFHVVISSRTLQSVQTIVASLKERYGSDAASGIQCHAGRDADRRRLLQHVEALEGSLAALVLNAAASTSYGPLLQTTLPQWEKMMSLNVTANFELVKLFAPLLVKGSSIVLMTSLAAYTPMANLGAYSITKTALVALCKVLSTEMAGRGIRVNAVAPGLIQTKFSEKIWMTDDGESKVFPIPMRRLGKAHDVSGVVSFLISNDAAYISGETIVVAGGATSRL